MEDKNFTTFEQQVEILRTRGLAFGNEEAAIKALQRYGYYNIINGYKDPYINTIDGKEHYVEGTTFEQVYALYTLDRNLRSVVMKSMLEVEDTLKTATAHTVAEAFTADESMYLVRNNYRPGKKIKDSNDYSIDSLFKKFTKIRNDNAEPVKHAREEYKNVPPWILLKEASFGNIVNFIKLQKGPQKRKIISLVYDIPESMISKYQEFYDLFMDTLSICLDYRNRAAHCGRIYNFETPAQFRFNRILHDQLNINEADYRRGMGKTGLIALEKALCMYDNPNIVTNLRGGVSFFVSEHCKIYPKDKTYLGKYLNTTI